MTFFVGVKAKRVLINGRWPVLVRGRTGQAYISGPLANADIL